MTPETIARALGGKKSGAGWMAPCIAHDDRTPSLHISIGRDGKPLVRCHAGCEQRDVITALRERGLWPESTQKTSNGWGEPTAIYDYVDEHGAGLYEVLRYQRLNTSGEREKRFLQRYRGDGGWIWKKHPRQVLYRLPAVLEAPIVFVVEGEKDCETLREYGFVATTNAGGAKAAWLPEFTDVLRGREVILIPDNDRPGLERGHRIARALLHNVAKLVIWMPDDAKDISEWFGRGHSELELISQVEGSEVSQ